MRINTVIPSLDRPAQLHLLLESLEKNASSLDLEVHVIYTYSTVDFEEGYEELIQRFPAVYFHFETSFQDQLNKYIKDSQQTLFFTDDCIFYRSFAGTTEDILSSISPNVNSFSFRLGRNITQQCYWTKELHPPFDLYDCQDEGEFIKWNFKIGNPYFNMFYNFSWDGNIYWSKDVLERLQGREFKNPREVESLIVQNIKARHENPRKYMVAPQQSCVFSNAINCVQSTKVPAGLFHAVTPETLNEKYLDGYIIDLNAMDFSQIKGCHDELPLAFRNYS